jgi:signal transduction histidine kinase
MAEATSLEQVASTVVEAMIGRSGAGAGALALHAGRGLQVVYVRGSTKAVIQRVIDAHRTAPQHALNPRWTVLRFECPDLEAYIALRGPGLNRCWLEDSRDGVFRLAAGALARVLAATQVEHPMAMLSHEMRTALTSIKGYASSLLRDDVAWDRETIREFATLIDEDADVLVQMISEVLDATYGVGRLQLSLEPVMVGKLVETLVGEAGRKDPAHRYVCSITPSLPAVWADPTRLKQVLRNLLDNAMKYATPGLVVVSARGDGGEVVVSVADQGPGLRPEHVNRLFERYFRVKQNGTAVAGTGLGLPVARDIVEQHGGRIWATSEEGRGTSVSFTIPAIRDVT